MRKKIIKSIYFTVAVVCLALLVSAFFINKPSEIRVSAYTKSYSINSKVNLIDTIDIEILVDQADSFYTDMAQIKSSYISGQEGEIKLKIKNICIDPANIYIYEEKFYIFHFIFEIDFSSNEEFELFIKEASLELSYLNGINSTIKIGSFSYYKYLNSSNDLMFSLLKVINTYQNDTNLYGFQIGIRNLSTYNINITNIKLLDINANVGEIKRIEEVLDCKDILTFFPNYQFINTIENINFKIEVNENATFAVCLSNMDDYTLMHPLEKLGIVIEYSINGQCKTFIFENFLFYEQNYIDYSKYSFVIYTYDNY